MGNQKYLAKAREDIDNMGLYTKGTLEENGANALSC